MKKVIIFVPLILILVVYGISLNAHINLGINLLKTTYQLANVFENELEQKKCNNLNQNYLKRIKSVINEEISESDFIKNNNTLGKDIVDFWEKH
jgi:hypothetical protein